MNHIETSPSTWTLMGWHIEVSALRILSVVASISFLALLGISTRFMILEGSSRSFLHKLDGSFRDKIVETTELPEQIKGKVIGVGSIEDLAKVSDETLKPFHIIKFIR
jgi:hypothetical protein